MPNRNEVVLEGYLGRAPEIKRTTKDVPVCNLSLATTRKWIPRGGQPCEETYWASVTIWAELAEVVVKRFHKGSAIGVRGFLRREQWTDARTGAEREATRVVAQSVWEPIYPKHPRLSAPSDHDDEAQQRVADETDRRRLGEPPDDPKAVVPGENSTDMPF